MRGRGEEKEKLLTLVGLKAGWEGRGEAEGGKGSSSDLQEFAAEKRETEKEKVSAPPFPSFFFCFHRSKKTVGIVILQPTQTHKPSLPLSFSAGAYTHTHTGGERREVSNAAASSVEIRSDSTRLDSRKWERERVWSSPPLRRSFQICRQLLLLLLDPALLPPSPP